MYRRRGRKENRPAAYAADIMCLAPRLAPPRRVPARYRSLLPLNLMLRYQCIVVGRSRGVLTVAIVNSGGLHIFPYIGHLTGCRVFPVIIDASSMRTLLRRVEQAECEQQPRHKYRRRVLSQDTIPSVNTIIQFLTSPSKKLYYCVE
ncbi:hypothetical protein [Dictyobacter alpinus]|uniref:GspE/PulE/PilB domain-containing protein n=1 Tax=Dictyobacter alpinus TaxID=2014873 RepID=UPI000F8419EE